MRRFRKDPAFYFLGIQPAPLPPAPCPPSLPSRRKLRKALLGPSGKVSPVSDDDEALNCGKEEAARLEATQEVWKAERRAALDMCLGLLRCTRAEYEERLGRKEQVGGVNCFSVRG